VVTITGVGTGTATVSVYAAETANYAQSNTVNISAEVNMSITKTITVYSAASDTVSFTDLTGAKTVTTNASGSGTVSVTIAASGQNITFTSSVAKNPDDLSDYFSKTINVSANTTAVYIMPNDNALYWYGFKSNNFESANANNGWSRSGYTFSDPTYHTNRISCVASGTDYKGVGTKNGVSSSTIYAIGNATNTKLEIRANSSKDMGNTGIEGADITSSTTVKQSLSNSQSNNYIWVGGHASTGYQIGGILEALWYE